MANILSRGGEHYSSSHKMACHSLKPKVYCGVLSGPVLVPALNNEYI